jgi:primosomal protein N' (replication factor Y)
MLWPLERAPLLSPAYMELIRQLALRQAWMPGNVLARVLPAGLRDVARLRLRVQGGSGPEQWTPAMLRAAAQETRGAAREDRQDAATALIAAWNEGRAQWLLPGEDAALSEECVLLKDPPWPVRATATRQRAVLEYLWERGAVSRRDMALRFPDGGAAVRTLVRHGLVGVRVRDWERGDSADAAREELVSPPADAHIEPNAGQRAVLDDCAAALRRNAFAAGLLYGVTGSGKTLVYTRLAEECLARGRSMLLLAPEVALAIKLRRDVRSALPDAPVFFSHGYQSPEYRERMFRALARREAASPPEACVIVGTRSALFLPAPNLGAIVLDEEHDASFKQDEGLTYQAKEIAWYRAVREKALLLMGSATPDVKSFYAARRGDMALYSLPGRAGGGSLPEISLVDIRGANAYERPLAPQTLLALRETIARGEQAVILLNRRGYAPHMYCLDCGSVPRCPDCDIGLTYHKSRERLVCHYCGYSLPFPALCPACRGLHYLPLGQGTERLEESVAAILPPGGRVLRLDRDSTRRPGRMEEILEAFARKQAQILVGTQMLSKGHHFPDVTLAVVADGDMGLNLPDYRAAERTFQLLVQSAGRAGRGGKSGRVIIQTRDTAHYCWQFVRAADYEGFYEKEIALREKRRYPPFVRLGLIRMSFAAQWKDGPQAVKDLAEVVRRAGTAGGVTVLGPAPAPLPLLRGRRRYQCLLKADDWQSIRAVYARALEARAPDLRIGLDLDPVNML